jgi:polyisoprenoid-binding protein YceI
MKKILSAVLLVILMTASLSTAATFAIDPVHSSIGFKIKHMVISKVRGSFGQFEGIIEFDEVDPALGSVSATITMDSIDTGDQKRDEHLRDADFFNTAEFPTMTFSSKEITKDGDDWQLKGNLTLHGVTRPVALKLEYNGSVDDPWGNHRVGFAAEGKIDRRDFGISWNNTLDKGGLALGNDVMIQMEIEAIRQ